MNDKIIELKEVTFSYAKKKNLLNELSLSLSAGHIHGLLGKNGEGKSTLLKLMSGLLFPQKGAVSVMGFNPQKRHPDMLKEIYFIPEELPEFTLSIEHFEKIYAPFYPKFNPEQFDQILREFQMDSKKLKLDKLSHGQKKKVVLAFGLATNTRVLLMDEPTNGLDIPSKGQFRRIVASTLEDDRCMIISTHQVRDLDRLIDNIVIMDEHEIVFNETIDRIIEKLCFKLYDSEAMDDTVIYSENTLRGFYQVRENRENEDSKLDIELLFNSVFNNKERIKKVFDKKEEKNINQ
ncbi:MAG: ABC transporter ATP-binding protein [Lentimicrobiaceae bacterium]|jgi:ABC-2 type transport system ATP-binding protein|nr:ABC transporter ATP-binding protein [Lentimicrobiaceae bacterium]